MSEMVDSLYIGRSASSPYTYTRMAFGSLAMFERVLSGDEIYTDYVTGTFEIKYFAKLLKFENNFFFDFQTKNS